MEILKDAYFELKPLFTTYIFEIKQQKKKFLIFSVISALICVLTNFILENAFPESQLADNLLLYLRGGIGFVGLLVLFGVCFFFSGIICAEFSAGKTGFVVFPKINKYKLILGKYLGDLTLILIVIGIYYFVLGLFGLYYYTGPIPIQFYQSFAIGIVYVIMLSAFVTFFSSFMKSVNITIISTILILLIVFSIVDQIVVIANPDFEPLYSFNYLGGLVSEVIQEHFPTKLSDRYVDITFEDFTYRQWITPSIEMGITVMLLYTVLFLGLASIIFKRKQL